MTWKARAAAVAAVVAAIALFGVWASWSSARTRALMDAYEAQWVESAEWEVDPRWEGV